MTRCYFSLCSFSKQFIAQLHKFIKGVPRILIKMQLKRGKKECGHQKRKKKWVPYDKEWDFKVRLQDLGEFGSRNLEQASHVLVFMVRRLSYN